MSRPNVLLIICHDLGQELGCYGRGYVRSPRLDQLAAEGHRLVNHFCTAPQCSPARSSLCTGRYPHSNGCMGLAHAEFAWGLKPSERHLARRFAEAGYDTALVGGQHVIQPPRIDELGFAENLGGGRSQVLADRAVAWLGNRTADTPFYLEINFPEPHRPWHCGDVAPLPPDVVEVPGWMEDWPEARAELAAQEASIHYADTQVGRVLDALEAAGHRDSTIVIFAADHGPAIPRAKCTLYDAGLATACVWRWPAGLPGGQTHTPLLSGVDLAPTLLEAVGLEVPAEVQGRSYLDLLRTGATSPRERIHAEKTSHGVYDPMRCVRTAEFKYIRNFQTGPAFDVPGDARTAYYARWVQEVGRGHHPATELYHLPSDPFERHNVSGQAEYAEREAELDRRLWDWMELTGDPLLLGPVPSPFYLRQLASRPRG